MKHNNPLLWLYNTWSRIIKPNSHYSKCCYWHASHHSIILDKFWLVRMWHCDASLTSDTVTPGPRSANVSWHAWMGTWCPGISSASPTCQLTSCYWYLIRLLLETPISIHCNIRPYRYIEFVDFSHSLWSHHDKHGPNRHDILLLSQ